MAEYIEREAVKRLANKKFVSTFCSSVDTDLSDLLDEAGVEVRDDG